MLTPEEKQSIQDRTLLTVSQFVSELPLFEYRPDESVSIQPWKSDSMYLIHRQRLTPTQDINRGIQIILPNGRGLIHQDQFLGLHPFLNVYQFHYNDAGKRVAWSTGGLRQLEPEWEDRSVKVTLVRRNGIHVDRDLIKEQLQGSIRDMWDLLSYYRIVQ